MNKKANSETLWTNVVYFVLLVFVISGLFIFINNQMNGASVWEDYYAKEIAKVINLAEPGDKISIDVYKATEIAKKNKVEDLYGLFRFDEKEKEICVRLSLQRRTCYGYFNEVIIKNNEIKFANPGNVLYFEVEKAEALK